MGKKFEYSKVCNDTEVFGSLTPVVSKFFKDKFKGKFTDAQKHAIVPIKHRKSILVSSPTGSGKTLCAFTSILDYLVGLAEKGELEDKVYAVYISPLKALGNDVYVNLIKPLEEVEKILGKELGIRVAIRTGDTTAYEKQKMLKKSPHILITTPESLAIVLNTPKFIEYMKGVEFCVVDEIHALDNKRGVHLSLSLERLQELSVFPMVRVGLSATIAPLGEIAMFLTGNRDCLIADVKFHKKIDVDVITPVDLIDTTGFEMHDKLYKLIDKQIQKHKTTLIFTNTRAATERVIHHLKTMFPKSYVDEIGAHHSSLSKEHRFDMEQRLREGKLKVVVTSTSLELGIDIGDIDLVLLLGSPKGTARALQRIGRAGHRLHEVAKGKFVILDRDDLIESSVIMKTIIEKKMDKVHIPKNCLDVLSQHIFGMAIYKIWDVDEMFKVIKRSYCYADLTKKDFLEVISYLKGDYALEARNVYAKIWYDEKTREIGKRGMLARVIYMTNIGTIPDEAFVNVKVPQRDGVIVGKVDEEFVGRLKKGDVFVLGGHKYQYLYTRGMNIYVRADVSKAPTIPSWFSEMLPLSFDLALEINRFRRLVKEKFDKKCKKKEMIEFIRDFLSCNEDVGYEIWDYMRQQYQYIGIPNIGEIIIEKYRAEKDYFVFHSLFGRRVNDALSRAIGFLIGRLGGRDVEIGISDNGFYLSGEKLDNSKIDKALKYLTIENIEEVLKEAIEKTEILKRRFRHCAMRSLMILKTYKGRRKSVGRQQMGTHFLLASVKKLDNNFPILNEARREVLEDLMDIKSAKLVLSWIKEGRIKIRKEETVIPSPFSLNLVMQAHSDLIKMEDRVEFLKRIYKSIESRIGSK
ncbi:MAG: ATP-dependent helicase [Nanoarchaeota archaeon]|nr:ATP-dependent helicase [Nanoarchaeota archaeon]